MIDLLHNQIIRESIVKIKLFILHTIALLFKQPLNGNCCNMLFCCQVKVFGVPLESLPQRRVVYGDVPCFLVDACSTLQEHIDTEGLFRKSGSIVRLKALRVSDG